MIVNVARLPAPESLSLFETAEGFYFEPNYSYAVDTKPTLQISRPSGALHVNEPLGFHVPSQPTKVVLGIMGMIQLLSGPYVIVITKRILVCKFLGHSVWRITGTELLACSNHLKELSIQQQNDEYRFINLLKSFLATEWIFYSSSLDLTRTVQSQTISKQTPEFIHADLRFIVNKFIAKPFLDILATRTDTRLEDFLAFCIEGFVEFQTVNVNQRKVTTGIISRRATGRVGTRYHSRGVDDNGNVSNFVETEQILVVDNDELASFVQIRGSIPLFWRQNINIRYKPPFEFYNHSKMSQIFEQHFKGLVNEYGTVTAVNLVNHRGWEGELAKAFARQSRDLSLPEYRYVPFDFNKECSRMQWDRVSGLLEMIDSDLIRKSYFKGQIDRTLVDSRLVFVTVDHKQSGIIRTNCIDCLDRTNLVQGCIGRRVLQEQLRELKIFGSSEKVQDYASLELALKQIWANNGDAISKQYSGTGALKADFTRTGRRTPLGMLADGLNSLMRYYLNNFTDGTRQDGMDLFYGHYSIKLEDYYSPFIHSFDNRLFFAPLIMLITFVGLVYNTFLYGGGFVWKSFLLALLGILFIFSSLLVLENGVQYVQYPKLRPPPVATYARPWARIISHPRRLFAPTRKVHII